MRSLSEDAPHEAAIQIRGLSKGFGRTSVLRDLDLDLPSGEVLTILGPNGSGKTTLIKVLATLTKPDEGSVRLLGIDATGRGAGVRRNVGVVTHEPLLYPELTAHENLKFTGRMFGLDRLDERIESVAHRLGVGPRLTQRVGTLSHGLRKRFSIARALLHDPLVLLMDEPESGLDQEALSLLDTIVSDQKNSGRTVVMTTHNLERGVALSYRMAVLADGRIAYQEYVGATSDAASLRAAYFQHTGVKA